MYDLILSLPGATALLPATSKEIRDIGWYFLPVVLLSSALAFAVALINNNIQRRYPSIWFTPPAPKPAQPSVQLDETPSSNATESVSGDKSDTAINTISVA